MHEDFLLSSAVASDVEYVHITEKDKYIAEDLINKGYLRKKGCRDLEEIQRQSFYEVSLPSAAVDTIGSGGTYQLGQIIGTNAYIGSRKEFFPSYDSGLNVSVYPYRSLSVCLSVCLSVFPSICLSVSQSVYLSFCLSVCLYLNLSVCLSFPQSACLSLNLSMCLSICLSVCLPVCLSVCLSIYLSVCLSVCLSLNLPVRLSICLSVCLSVCLSFSLPAPKESVG